MEGVLLLYSESYSLDVNLMLRSLDGKSYLQERNRKKDEKKVMNDDQKAEERLVGIT